jgi:hypothetical protein
MGLKHGEEIEPLGIIRVVSVRREPLSAITADDCAREGFPELSPDAFVEMFKSHMGCHSSTTVTRIEFEHVMAERQLHTTMTKEELAEQPVTMMPKLDYDRLTEISLDVLAGRGIFHCKDEAIATVDLAIEARPYWGRPKWIPDLKRLKQISNDCRNDRRMFEKDSEAQSVVTLAKSAVPSLMRNDE